MDADRALVRIEVLAEILALMIPLIEQPLRKDFMMDLFEIMHKYGFEGHKQDGND